MIKYYIAQSYNRVIIIKSNSLLEEKANEKAAITFACGVAATQVYTSSVSGTFGVNQAFDAYIRFGFDEAILLDENDTSLYTHLSQNMMDARPVHLAVVDPPGTMGHNVVIDGYNTNEYLEKVKCPVLLIHSLEDEIVPFSHGQKLFNTANEPKKFLEIRGTHNVIQSMKDYQAGIDAFISEFIDVQPH